MDASTAMATAAERLAMVAAKEIVQIFLPQRRSRVKNVSSRR
jgi:hypothetical protein